MIAHYPVLMNTTQSCYKLVFIPVIYLVSYTVQALCKRLKVPIQCYMARHLGQPGIAYLTDGWAGGERCSGKSIRRVSQPLDEWVQWLQLVTSRRSIAHNVYTVISKSWTRLPGTARNNRFEKLNGEDYLVWVTLPQPLAEERWAEVVPPSQVWSLKCGVLTIIVSVI